MPVPTVMLSGLRRRAALVAVAATAVSVGCGIKDPPLPPVIRIAETTRDLHVHQEGRSAVLVWSYPSSTTAGDPLTELESIEVWRAAFNLVEAPPAADNARDRDLNHQLLLSGGERIAVLDHGALDAATRGSTLELRDRIGLWTTASTSDEPQILWYSVRTVCCRGRESALSNIARLAPRAPPEPPTDLAVEPTADGLRLTWTPSDDLPTLIERSSDGDRFTSVGPGPVAAREWVDSGAAQGRAWHYRLRSMLQRDGQPRVVGEPGPAIGLLYADDYPPAVPTELVCLPEGTRVRLRWQAVPDAESYRVVRISGGEAPTVLVSELAATELDDTAPPPGTSIYQVCAIDAAGNRGDAATCTAARGSGS